MKSTRLAVSFVVAASALALAAACSSSSSGSGTSGGTGTSSGSVVDKCGTNSSGSSSNCKNGELEAYSTCVQDKCDSKYKECLGPNYKSGSFSGACGTYISCTNACDCNDNACKAKCTLDSACQTCFSGFSSCQSQCTVPACASAGSSGGTSGTSGGTSGTSGGTSGTSGGGSGKGCADLAACCAAITDTTIKPSCDQAKTGAGTDDSLCTTYYNAFKTYCP